MVLCDKFPQILNKFKHITSLCVKYKPTPRSVDRSLTHIPYIFTKATYKPHNYCLSVLTFTSFDVYSGQQEHYPTHSAVNLTKVELEFCTAIYIYASALFYLHHRLVLSIRDHKLLERVVVSDYLGRETFSLADKQLVKLRNITSPELAQVQGYRRRSFCDVLNCPFPERDYGFVFKNISYSIFEKWDNSSGPEDDIPPLKGKGS